MAMATRLNTIQLIEMVRKYPFLYDKFNENYKDVTLKENRWSEISTELNSTVEQVKKKWRNLRDRYVKEKRALNLPSGSGSTGHHKCNWDLYPILDGFLRASVEPRDTIDNFNSSLELMFYDDNSPNIPSVQSPTLSTDSMENKEKTTSEKEHELPYKKRRTEVPVSQKIFQEANETLKAICEKSSDEISLYCQSLAFRLRSLSEKKRRHARLKIEQLMFDIEEEEK